MYPPATTGVWNLTLTKINTNPKLKIQNQPVIVDVVAKFTFTGTAPGPTPVTGTSILTLRSNSRGLGVSPNVSPGIKIQGISPIIEEDYVQDSYGNMIRVLAPPNAKLKVTPHMVGSSSTIL